MRSRLLSTPANVSGRMILRYLGLVIEFVNCSVKIRFRNEVFDWTWLGVI